MSLNEPLHWLPALVDSESSLRSLRSIVDPTDRIAASLRLAHRRLDFTQIGVIDRAVEKAVREGAALPEGVRRLKLAWLASSTISHLIPSVRVAALRRGILLDVYVPPYGQHRQALLDPSSGLGQFAPEVVLLALDPNELVPGLRLSATASEVAGEVETKVDEMRALWCGVRDDHRAVVLQHTAPDLAPPLFGSLDASLPASPSRVAREVNRALTDAAAASGVVILDLEAWSAPLGRDAWFDPVRWHQAKQLVSPAVAPLYGDLVARVLGALRGASRKCLVLDLDNTLWGGVVGDDGLEGIVLGQGSATGEAYQAFQRYVLALKERGVILAVCSKNDSTIAGTAFEQHPDMVLRRADIAAFVANWEDKATNLRAIAKTLNIGLDALVFFDDNPAERALVRSELPEVAVPEPPDDPAGYVRCLADAGYFEAVTFTADDAQRATQYAANTDRRDAMASATDVQGFLRGLDMHMQVGPFDDANLARIVQLVNKTNQFNLTTRRYTEPEVRALTAGDGVIHLWARLVDRFGDNGLVSVVVAKPVAPGEKHRLVIDTWLMSCRVLGRGVERAMLNYLVAAAASQGTVEIVGEYLPTAKNEMVRDLYDRLGFERHDSRRDGAARWRLTVSEFSPSPTHIAIETSQPSPAIEDGRDP